jgi:hypothetical protein
MRWLALLLIVAAGCKHKPCATGTFQIDSRPLPEEWADVVAPDGAAMCWDPSKPAPPSDGSVRRRTYDVPATSSDEALVKWKAALATRGWSKTPERRAKESFAFEPDACALLERFDHPTGLLLHLRVDRCTKTAPGWSLVAVERVTK